jgi:hypothetical protein
VIVRIAWIAVILLPVLVILGEWLFSTNGGDSSVGAETQRKAGLAIVRVAWITAILVPLLVILAALTSGSDGGDSSRLSPEVASARPAAPLVGAEAQKTKAPAPRDGHRQLAREQTEGGSHPSSGAPLPSAPQPGGGGGGAPEVTPQPKPPRAPQPKPQPAPPQTPTPSAPPVSQTSPAPVQTTTTTVSVANNNTDGP